MSGVRVYGHSIGNGSFKQVSRGICEALVEHGVFAGFVPIDSQDEEVVYPGALARVSINVGAPSAVAYAQAMGDHESRWLMLAPNSDRIPPAMKPFLRERVHGLLTPSQWGKEVLEATVDLPVVVCPHGVHPEFRVIPELHEKLIQRWERGEFSVLHIASTVAQRKGTRELVAAWKQLMSREQMYELELVLKIDMKARALVELWIEGLGDVPNVRFVTSFGEAGGLAHAYQRHHLVVAPSRAEGFGLVPLEARACGVPVCATLCGGHRQHMDFGAREAATWGIQLIETGPDAPVDDLPSSKAPSLDAESVSSAIAAARLDWLYAHKSAVERAAQVADVHAWPNASGPVLQALEKGDIP